MRSGIPRACYLGNGSRRDLIPGATPGREARRWSVVIAERSEAESDSFHRAPRDALLSRLLPERRKVVEARSRGRKTEGVNFDSKVIGALLLFRGRAESALQSAGGNERGPRVAEAATRREQNARATMATLKFRSISFDSSVSRDLSTSFAESIEMRRARWINYAASLQKWTYRYRAG